MKITLYWKYLKYEIDYETWKAAKVRITDNPELLNEAQSGLDSEDVHFCQVKIKEAIAHLNEMLYRFVTFASGDGSDVVLTDNASWEFQLHFKGRRSINADSLASEMHHYVSYYVLREWSKLALPDMHEAYGKRCEEERDRIVNLAYRKSIPLLSDIDESGAPEDGHVTLVKAASSTVTGCAKVKINGAPDSTYATEVLVPTGSKVVLKVTPGSGNTFTAWEDGSIENPRTVTVISEGEMTFTALVKPTSAS